MTAIAHSSGFTPNPALVDLENPPVKNGTQKTESRWKLLSGPRYEEITTLICNLLRVGLTGGLSFLGGIVAGDPRIAATIGVSILICVYLGAALGGTANALSTYMSWKTDSDKHLEEARQQIALLQESQEQLARENKALAFRIDNVEMAFHLKNHEIKQDVSDDSVYIDIPPD